MTAITEDDVTESLDRLTEMVERLGTSELTGREAPELNRMAREITQIADRSASFLTPATRARMRAAAAVLRTEAKAARKAHLQAV